MEQVAKDLLALFLHLLTCLSQRPLLESKGPLVEKLQLLLPVVLAGDDKHTGTRPGRCGGRESASFSIFGLYPWIWGAEQVLGGTQARETSECFCLGNSVLGTTSCYKTALATHWELFGVGKPLTCPEVLPGFCFCRKGVTVQRKLACTLSATETFSVEVPGKISRCPGFLCFLFLPVWVCAAKFW